MADTTPNNRKMTSATGCGTNSTAIRDFYRDTSVFITGGTGFLGKILIDKLLRCTDVAAIYLLIRPKKGKDISTRLDQLFDDAIFERLKREVPKYQMRVEPVAGDCALAGLGLSITDRQRLEQRVHIVFHVAATVNFNERLDLAYDINVNGTIAVVELAKHMSHLKSLVHVSTAYSNCHLPRIDEKFYDYPIRYDELADMLAKLDASEIAQYSERIVGAWPNTYTFTKAMAETVIRDASDTLPVGVFRPAIVTSTYREPVPGWTDNLYGPTGIMAAAATGVLRTMHADDAIAANVVPVDTCVAALIAAAWDVGTRGGGAHAIYNYVSTVENPISWAEHNAINQLVCEQAPMARQVWKVGVFRTRSPWQYSVAKFWLHLVPAAIVDAFQVLTGQNSSMLKLYGKIHKFSAAVSHFSLTAFEFSNGNVQALYERMSPEDRKLFPMSMRDVHWLEYYRNYMPGIRQYLLKDPVDNVPRAIAKQRRLNIIDMVFKYLFVFLATNAMWGVMRKIAELCLNTTLALS